MPKQISIEVAEKAGVFGMALARKTNLLGSYDRYEHEHHFKRVMGTTGGVFASAAIDDKAALTGLDIPMPEEFGVEVAALVDTHGAARRWGTVFPMRTTTAKLPKMKTEPVFGLLAMSASVTEKSPQTEFVTFEPKKWGGMVRTPSEIVMDGGPYLGGFLISYGARGLAKAEDQLYFMGDGSADYDSLKGLCFSVIDNSKVHQLAAGKTAYSDFTLTDFRAVRDVTDAAVRQDGGAYYLHPSWEQKLCAFNADGDRPFNQNAPGGPTLDGYPVRYVPVMPVYSASANAGKVGVLFGDLRYHFLAVRPGLTIKATGQAIGAFENDEILFLIIERFTIGLMADGAVAGIETAAA